MWKKAASAIPDNLGEHASKVEVSVEDGDFPSDSSEAAVLPGTLAIAMSCYNDEQFPGDPRIQVIRTTMTQGLTNGVVSLIGGTLGWVHKALEARGYGKLWGGPPR